MTWWEAFILGIVQGLTEFLPVSSSGHLEIGHALLGTTSEENLTFAITVHAATVLSTIAVLWSEIRKLFNGTFLTKTWNTEKEYVAKILLSMIPVFIIGIFFKDQVEAFFGNGLLLVGICLLITACLLGFSEWYSKHYPIGHGVTYRDAFIIGCAQAIAVLPGLSRSGTTIATGLICGVKKEQVAQFSFLMVLIPILGEAFLDVLDLITEEGVTTSIDLFPLTIGFLSAFVIGCLACRFMLDIVRKQKLIYFAIYCLIIGGVAITYSIL